MTTNEIRISAKIQIYLYIFYLYVIKWFSAVTCGKFSIALSIS